MARVSGGAAATRFSPRERHAPPLISDEWLTRVWAHFGPGGRRESQPRLRRVLPVSVRAGPDQN
jgi:hypothetical protein